MKLNASFIVHLLITFLIRSHAEDLPFSSFDYYIFLTAYWINGRIVLTHAPSPHSMHFQEMLSGHLL